MPTIRFTNNFTSTQFISIVDNMWLRIHMCEIKQIKINVTTLSCIILCAHIIIILIRDK